MRVGRSSQILSLFLLLAAYAFSNPTGPEIISGQVGISDAQGELLIHQSSPRAIINWQDFSIQANEITRILQPNKESCLLNRVVGSNMSQIHGSLEANGRVYLLNPQGVLIGKEGSINTAGFVFSALSLSNETFFNGGKLTFSGDGEGSFINQGAIKASCGDVFIFARKIDNQGRIEADGTVGLCACSEVVLMENEHTAVVKLSSEGSVENEGVIEAASAEIRASGNNIFGCAINNTGMIFANRAIRKNGKILLVADEGRVEVSGKLEAKGQEITVLGPDIVING